MGLLTLLLPSDQTRFADTDCSVPRLLPETVTVKDCFSYADFTDRTLGVTLMESLDPGLVTTFAMYVEFGLPTFVTVLWKVTLNDPVPDTLADIVG